MRFLIRRTARAILTLWVGLSIAFFIVRFMPGNPLDARRRSIARDNPNMSPAQVEERVQAYADRIGIDYDAPLPEQYLEFWTDLFTGDLGVSVSENGQEVASIVGEALPWTLFVVVVSTVVMAIIAVSWGALIAYKEGSWLDTISSSTSILMAAIPSYVLAFALIIVLGYGLGWFPTKYTTGQGVSHTDGLITFYIDAIYHAILPIASIVFTQAGVWILSMRGNSIQTLGEDYVRVGRLRGLSDRRISTRYVARNAMLPLYTGFLMLIGYNMGASIILEEIFRYRGIGWYMLNGLNNNDYALVMGTFIVYAGALVIAVYIADLTYSYIDPRVKSGDTSEAY